jgi:hypothetical protein
MRQCNLRDKLTVSGRAELDQKVEQLGAEMKINPNCLICPIRKICASEHGELEIMLRIESWFLLCFVRRASKADTRCWLLMRTLDNGNHFDTIAFVISIFRKD